MKCKECEQQLSKESELDYVHNQYRKILYALNELRYLGFPFSEQAKIQASLNEWVDQKYS